ncbi:MAG: rhodanese-like domain-containing protein [Paracoccaceae bacterium]
MGTDTGSMTDVATPAEAYAALKSAPGTALVDVRTRAEWSFVGIPDISETGRPFWPVEWQSFPDMSMNPRFVDEIRKRIETHDGPKPIDRLLFICRSGARSHAAAEAVAAAFGTEGRAVRCTNVTEGFEGDLDAAGHRGRSNGWKAADLPWRQN